MNDNVRSFSPQPRGHFELQAERLLSNEAYRKRLIEETITFAASLMFELMGGSLKPDSKVQIVLEDFPDDIIQVSNAWKLPGTERKIDSVINLFSRLSTGKTSHYLGFVLTDACEILEYEKSGYAKDDLGLLHVAGRHAAIFTGKDTLIQKGYADDLVQAGLDNLANKVDRSYLPE